MHLQQTPSWRWEEQFTCWRAGLPFREIPTAWRNVLTGTSRNSAASSKKPDIWDQETPGRSAGGEGTGWLESSFVDKDFGVQVGNKLSVSQQCALYSQEGQMHWTAQLDCTLQNETNRLEFLMPSVQHL